MPDQITVRGARLHNLKNISVSIPKNKLVVLTGLSGSGKSTLGFDILFKEGQRQYLESLGLAEFGLSKPPVDSITGLSPTISVDQHLTNHSPRSTVGTATEVLTYLRVLFARLGHRPCPACGKDIPPSFDPSSMEWEGDSIADEDAEEAEQSIACPHCGARVPELIMGSFSFNKPEGACPTCTGLGVVHQADLSQLVDDSKSIPEGAVGGWNAALIKYEIGVLEAAARHYGLKLDMQQPVKDWARPAQDLLYYGVDSPQFVRQFPERKAPITVTEGHFEGVATAALRRYASRIQDAEYREKAEEQLIIETCPDCQGTRLKAESRKVSVKGKNIVQLSELSLEELGEWLRALPDRLDASEKLVAAPVLVDLTSRIERLVEVGAGYLTTARSSPTLSAGEAQRLRLASLLGSGLSGLLYVFDEPTIGLHARDTHRLIGVLKQLRDLGNTVLVIEHDPEMIEAADHVVDFGPGAGRNGGQVVAEGTPHEIESNAASVTGDYLAHRRTIAAPDVRRSVGGRSITVRGARENNLKDLTVHFPLGVLIAVTGVSGSGKSSLVFDVLDRAIRRRLTGSREVPGEHDAIEGLDQLGKIITIDQEHIGRMPRSNAATYSDAFTPIREAFAATAEARQHKLSAKYFSFNVPGGRCERCEGAGVITVKMQLLPDVEVRCPACHGRRFKPNVLGVHYGGYDISQVLDMTIDEALPVFRDVPAALARLQVLSDVGLGYLQLGQPATTLSGGEAQRVKLAKELGRRGNGHTLYLLDEPTTGLHLADTARLLAVLQRLVDAGNTVIVVEHNLELVKTADWVIDLGPEGGAAGGQIVAQGRPEDVAAVDESYTGQCLKPLLEASRVR